MPLGVVLKRSGRAGGFVVGILIMLSFYVLNVLADFWVSSGFVSPFAAAWFPNMAFGVLTMALFLRKGQALRADQ